MKDSDEKKQITGYNSWWCLVFYDLPNDTSSAKTASAKFRRWLLESGGNKFWSCCWIKFCASREKLESFTAEIKKNLPPDGNVKVLGVTDKQFGQIQIMWGKMRKPEPLAD